MIVVIIIIIIIIISLVNLITLNKVCHKFLVFSVLAFNPQLFCANNQQGLVKLHSRARQFKTANSNVTSPHRTYFTFDRGSRLFSRPFKQCCTYTNLTPLF